MPLRGCAHSLRACEPVGDITSDVTVHYAVHDDNLVLLPEAIRHHEAVSSLLSIITDYDDISTAIISLDHDKEPRLEISFTLFTAKISREERERDSQYYMLHVKRVPEPTGRGNSSKTPFTVGRAHGNIRERRGRSARRLRPLDKVPDLHAH